MYIVIVGGGNVGYYLARRLHRDRHSVALVEKDRARCELISQELDILAVHGDGCEVPVLEAAGIERTNVFAAVTGTDEDNLVACQLARDVFHVERTVARVNDSRHEHIFNQLGVDVPIDSTGIIARIIEEEVSLSDFVNLVTFRKGNLALVRFDLPADSPVIGQAVASLKLPAEAVLVAVVRAGGVFIPRGDTVFEAQDEIIALTRIGDENVIIQTFLGKI